MPLQCPSDIDETTACGLLNDEAAQMPRSDPFAIGAVSGYTLTNPQVLGVLEFATISTKNRYMEYDESKIDEMTLALMFLTSFSDGGAMRSWKGYDWDALGRLHAAGLIHDPVGKAKSVMLTEEGEKRSRELFQKHFAQSSRPAH